MQGRDSVGGEGGHQDGWPAARFDSSFEPLLAVLRGTTVESVHRGAVAVAGVDGEVLGGLGDPLVEVLLRSAAKPFQVAAVIDSGAADAFGVSDAEIAVMAASHAGAPEHVEVVGRLLERTGCLATDLVCGSVEHMCSGKHAGMLLLARHLGVAADGYQRKDHPVQREIAAYIASLLDTCPRRSRSHGGHPVALFAGRDGCGVPVISTTLYEAAWLYAALAAGSTPALARVRDAMAAHPGLVAGEGRYDTRLITAGAGRVVAKGGAEGVEGIAAVQAGLVSDESVAEGAAIGHATSADRTVVGCVVKVEDGSARPIPPVVALFLRAWGMADVAATLERDYPATALDAGGVEVGRLEVLAEQASLRRLTTGSRTGGRPAAVTGADAAAQGAEPRGIASEVRAGGPRRFGGKGDRVTVCRGDEKDVLRFLREEWPAVDEENFGRRVEWSAEPYALVFRRDKKMIGVLKGHFIGGLASVDELMVGKGSRGMGLGSFLLGRFEDEARRRRCARIVLRAVKDSPAEHFYWRRGYHRECVQYAYEFGYDYVRLTCDVEKALGEAGGSSGEGKETG